VALWIGAVLLVCNFGSWYSDSICTTTQYKAHTAPNSRQLIQATVGISISLRGINITLKEEEDGCGKERVLGSCMQPRGSLHERVVTSFNIRHPCSSLVTHDVHALTTQSHSYAHIKQKVSECIPCDYRSLNDNKEV